MQNKGKTFKISSDKHSVEVRSNFRLPFEAKGNQFIKTKKTMLRREIEQLSPRDPGDILVASLSTRSTQFFDVENILFYNIGPAAFRKVAKNGIMIKVGIPSDQKYRYNYSVECPNFKNYFNPDDTILDFSFEVPKISTGMKTIDYWYWIHQSYSGIDEISWQDKDFGLYIELHCQVEIGNIASIMKSLVDGIICSAHYHEEYNSLDPDLTSRIERTYKNSSGLLSKKPFSFLGPRSLVFTYRSGIKWNPQDEICKEIIILPKYDQDLQKPFIKGFFYKLG